MQPELKKDVITARRALTPTAKKQPLYLFAALKVMKKELNKEHAPLRNKPKGSCRCGAPKRRGGYTCNACRRADRNEIRQEYPDDRRKWPQWMERMFVNNPVTKERFKRIFGNIPHVYVPASETQPYGDFRAIVVAFRPGDIVTVMHECQETNLIDLHFSELRRDDRAPHYRPVPHVKAGYPEDPKLRRRMNIPIVRPFAKSS